MPDGPFWDVMEGRAAPPPAATLLGWELLAIDPEAGTIEVAFTAREQFLNPVGAIQGGFLAAMLDDTRAWAVGAWAGWRLTSGRGARPLRTAAGRACGSGSAGGRRGSRAR